MCTRAIGEDPVVTSSRQSRSVWDPASSSAALLESGETHACYEGGSRRAGHLRTPFLRRAQSPLSVLYGGYYFQLFFLG